MTAHNAHMHTPSDPFPRRREGNSTYTKNLHVRTTSAAFGCIDIPPVWGTDIGAILVALVTVTHGDVSYPRVDDCHRNIVRSRYGRLTKGWSSQRRHHHSERKLTLNPKPRQTFDTNYSISAKGRKAEVHLESHVAGVMMLFPEHTKKEETTFRHFAILGSNLGPRNTIIVTGYLSAVLSREIKGSAASYLTYRVDGQDETN